MVDNYMLNDAAWGEYEYGMSYDDYEVNEYGGLSRVPDDLDAFIDEE